MTKKEKTILKKAIKHHRGIMSPSDMINGIANKDQKSVESLVVKEYLEEVPREHHQNEIVFYRVTEKGCARVNVVKWLWFIGGDYLKFIVSSMLGAYLALNGNIYLENYKNAQEEKRLADQIKWEIYENISDTFSNEKSVKLEKSFISLKTLNPKSSILDHNFHYWSTYSARDQLYKARSNDFGLLNIIAMKDILNFYSLLDSVDENNKKLENVFINEISAKSETVLEMGDSLIDNIKRMRTIGAQAVGKLMYYYDAYDFDLEKKENKDATTQEIIKNLLAETNKYVDNKKSGEIISNMGVAEHLNLYSTDTYNCFSSFDVCALATSHYLMLKTEKVLEDVQVYNGCKKK